MAQAAALEAQNAAKLADDQALAYSTALQMGSLAKLGSVARDEDRTGDAQVLWQDALDLAESAPVQHEELDLMRHAVLHQLAELHLANRETETARTYCTDAIAIAARYAGEDLTWRRRVGFAEILRGRLALADKHYEVSLAAFTRSVGIRREFVGREPDSVSHRVDLAHALSLRGRAARKLKRMDDALAHYSEAHNIRLALYEEDPNSGDYALELANAEAKLGVWHIVQKTDAGNVEALKWIGRAEQRLSQMAEKILCDNRPAECRQLSAALSKNRAIVERRRNVKP